MEEIYRSQFRLPYSLYEQLKASADRNHRSVNAELVARLEASYDCIPESRSVTAEEGSYIPGVDNGDPIETKLAKMGISKMDLLNAVSHAIENAISDMGYIPLPPDNAKPQPNTGPKPRTPWGKK